MSRRVVTSRIVREGPGRNAVYSLTSYLDGMELGTVSRHELANMEPYDLIPEGKPVQLRHNWSYPFRMAGEPYPETPNQQRVR